MQAQTRQTPLYAEHKRLKAKMVPFGGWLMPVSYEGVLKEHHNVRQAAGLFDVSHMGEFLVRGSDAEAFLQYLTINDVSRLRPGEGQYSAFCLPSGGMIDDLFLYRLTADEYFLCVNAANIDKDFAWVEKQAAAFAGKSLAVTNASAQWSQLAIQGPNSLGALKAVVEAGDWSGVQQLPYTHIMSLKLGGQLCRLARTGYTGEKGYELYLPNSLAVEVWQKLLGTSPETGIMPIGLGARDTLRLEACYLLYGNDMDEAVSPLEAGIAWATKLDGKDFIGKGALVEQKERGIPRRIYAFQMEEQGIPRHGMDVYSKGERIGQVSSGSVLPSLGGAGGMALLASQRVQLNETVSIDIRGSHKAAKIVKRPLYEAKAKD